VKLVSDGFFVLRTPALPFEDLATAASDRDALRAWSARPDVEEALSLAAPGLLERVHAWRTSTKPDAGIERALVRYAARMASRSTPQGLLAGASVGTIAETTKLEIDARSTWQRSARVELSVIERARDALLRDPGTRARLTFQTSSGIYRVTNRLRAFVRRAGTGPRRFDLAEVDASEELDILLALAAEPRTREALSIALAERCSGATPEETLPFIDEVIDAQLLAPAIGDALTSSLEPLDELAAHCEGERRTTVENARAALAAPENLHDAMATVASLSPEPRMLRIDLRKPARELALGTEVVKRMREAIVLLADIAPRPKEAWRARFVERFAMRYGERAVPLMEALDDELGIGLDATRPDESELLAGGMPAVSAAVAAMPFGARDAYLLHRLGGLLRDGALVWNLEDRDLRGLHVSDALPLPDAVAFKGSIGAASAEALRRGDFDLVVDGIVGPSGGRLLGRLAGDDSALREALAKHTDAEEAANPDAVFAEIVHVPAGHAGNVLRRPALRRFEIPILARSSVDAEHRIALDDLVVRLRHGVIELWSRRLGRRVLPRLTIAHHHSQAKNLAVYRFLCALQEEGVSSRLRWDWGALESSPFLPRVVRGHIVLSRARWLFDSKDPATASPAALTEWRRRFGAPRYVMLQEADQAIAVDLDNALSVDALLQRARARPYLTLVEMLPAPTDLAVSGPEGRYVHEVIVPFSTRSRAATDARAPSVSVDVAKRSFPPGSEWLYLKAYGGASNLDRVLSESVAPVVRSLLDRSAIDRWFFVRYRDPEHHLRLRLHGDPTRLDRDVRPALESALRDAQRSGLMWRIEGSTYEREVERYGGLAALQIAESVFHADSDAVLALLDGVIEGTGRDPTDVLRWRAALRGIDGILAAFGVEPPSRVAVLRARRDALIAEIGTSPEALRRAGVGYRMRAAELDRIITVPDTPPSPGLASAWEAMAARDAAIAALAPSLLAAVAVQADRVLGSFLHMHVNRVFARSPLEKEIVLYDWLSRAHAARIARRARKSDE
jgi:thiopeptide-type bacteriocin biosynthesis protein